MNTWVVIILSMFLAFVIFLIRAINNAHTIHEDYDWDEPYLSKEENKKEKKHE